MNDFHRRLKILFIAPRFPWPLVGGDRIKSYHILKYLAQNHHVVLATFCWKGVVDEEQSAAIKNLGIELYTAPIYPLRAGIRSSRSFFNGLPLEIAFYTQPQLSQIVDKLCEANQFDLGISFFMRTAEYMRHRSFKKLLIAEDCRLMYQSRSSEASESLKQRLVRKWEVRQLSVYEPEIVNDFDCTTLVTHEDIQAMHSQNPRANYALLTNGVELETYAPNFNMRSRKGILFGGKLDVWANEQMAHSLVVDILPAIRNCLPDASLRIVGANPSQRMQKLAGDYVKIYANVHSFIPFLQSAAVFIHPHRGASGIQNKILQAMSCGCPIVTTPTGIQGIAAQHGKDVMIAQSKDEIIRHAITLLSNPAFAQELAQNARKIVEKNHSWVTIDYSLNNILTELFPEVASNTKVKALSQGGCKS